MKSILGITIALLVALSVMAGCAGPGTEPAGALPPPVDELDAGLVEANTQFALNLLRELHRLDPDSDLFFSPASVSVALAMTYNGADGATFDAIARTLGLDQMSLDRVNRGYADLLTILRNPDPELELDVANSIWARQGLAFHQEFLDTNLEYYGATTRELDFDDPQASVIINNWVKEATRSRIEKIVPDDIRPDTIMFLINAIYFKGEWTDAFDPEDTQEDTFRRDDGSTATVPFMNQRGEYRYYEGEDIRGIAIPYGEQRLNMYVLLPDEGEDVEALIRRLEPSTWSMIMEGLGPREVDLSLPRFTIEYEETLNDVLRAMGMEIAFDRTEADFSRMYPISPGQNVYIGEVKHKAFVDVSEEGTEAAAATSVEMRLESAMETTAFRADRPFLFAIGDDVTGTILFLGVYGGEDR